MIRLRLHAIALVGPGLVDWTAAQPVLRGDAPYQQAATVLPPALRLPPTERRRVGQSVKIAMAVADQLFANCTFPAADTATLFTSSGGDGENCHILCEALDSEAPMLSPTRFTNSVHNAPSGYWSIAAASGRAATTLCAYDASFSAGLIEAGVYASYEREPIALIAYDVPYPEPIHSKRPIGAPFGVALILSGADSGLPAVAELGFDRWVKGSATAMADPALESLRQGIPAARSLPLLAELARGADPQNAQAPRRVDIGANDDRVLPVTISRCQ